MLNLSIHQRYSKQIKTTVEVEKNEGKQIYKSKQRVSAEDKSQKVINLSIPFLHVAPAWSFWSEFKAELLGKFAIFGHICKVSGSSTEPTIKIYGIWHYNIRWQTFNASTNQQQAHTYITLLPFSNILLIDILWNMS